MVFGFVAILKYSLDGIGVATAAHPKCPEKIVHLILPALHALFVLGQTIFLFFYAKVNIQRFTHFARFSLSSGKIYCYCRLF